MHCPKCQCKDNFVLSTRKIRGGLRRRRECKCGNRFNTVELQESIADGVLKFMTDTLRKV